MAHPSPLRQAVAALLLAVVHLAVMHLAVMHLAVAAAHPEP